MTVILSQQFSLINSWINELRNVEIQHDRMRFRRNMERIGEIAAFEISKSLEYEEIEIQKCLVRCLRPVTQLVSELNSAVSLWSPSSYATTLIPPLAHSLGKLNCKILEEKISRQVV